MAKYRTATSDEWNPPLRSSGRKRDELDEQMGVLEEGHVLIIEAEDEKELRGRRLALGRRAKALGIAIEQYTQGQTIYARKKEETPSPSPAVAAAPQRRRGRKRRLELDEPAGQADDQTLAAAAETQVEAAAAPEAEQPESD